MSPSLHESATAVETLSTPNIPSHGAAPASATWLEPASPVLTYVGALVAAVGFALIGIAWAKVAGLLVVGLQLPYVVSAGFTGMGLVMLGLVLVNIAARRQDAAERARQMRVLTETLQGLRDEITRLSRAEL